MSVAATTSKPTLDGWADDVRLSDIEPTDVPMKSAKKGSDCNAAPIAVGVTVQLRTAKGGNGNETFSFIGMHPLNVYGFGVCR
jgi:hypothetical protein